MSAYSAILCRVVCHMVCLACINRHVALARMGLGDTEQDWGYIMVRPNAHMFWWLYYTTADVSNYTERPLIIWLQGGPGMPSSGHGNFAELGPQNTTLGVREETVVKNFNILFIDNPVGAGYSYISDNATKHATNGTEIAEDLYTFFKQWLKQNKEFRKVPTYVFGESYGGKMATEFVHNLVKKSNSTSEICNLKGLALGDSYISPIDYVQHYAPLAYHLGLIDKQGFTRIDELAKQIQVLISMKEFELAADMEDAIMDTLFSEMVSIDMYNMMNRRNQSTLPGLFDHLHELRLIMNDEVKKKLEIYENITWSFYNDDVHLALKRDLMQSVTDKIEFLLNNTDLKVIVYNGILDFIVNTAGTITWLDNLSWKGRSKWLNGTQTSFEVNMAIEGYVKKTDKLVFYAVLRAGHSVPGDNLPAMNEILRRELLS